MKKPLVMLLAGGGGTRLGVLVDHRSKPAVPFAGRYRIIDFALSNVMHAGFDWVGVLTQYKPLSLMSHIGTGEPWNFWGRRRGVRILPPRTGHAASDWYRGTADAIWQSMDFMEPLEPERVLILSGDHIYRMSYQAMVDRHLEAGADVSIACMEVSPRDSSRFGMIHCDSDGLITRFEEKPAQTDSRLASMGIYLFEWRCLKEALREQVDVRKGTDFGQDVMPALLGKSKMKVHRFGGYWRDVGTVSSYYHASLDAFEPSSGLDLGSWEICTIDTGNRAGDLPPSSFGPRAGCDHVLVSAGCRIEGRVANSVISPGVHIAEGATVSDCILMNGVKVEAGAVVRRAIIDKDVRVGSGAVVGGSGEGRELVANAKYSKCDLEGIVLVGKAARLPSGVRIHQNVVVEAGSSEASFGSEVAEGSTVERALQS